MLSLPKWSEREGSLDTIVGVASLGKVTLSVNSGVKIAIHGMTESS